MRRIRSHLTYSNVMSTIAVFGVLAGGTAWAASKIGSNGIQNGAVTAKKLHKNAVKTKKIANGQVRAGDLGPITIRTAEPIHIDPGNSNDATALCREGERVLSGGNSASYFGTDAPQVSSSRFDANVNGWSVDVQNPPSSAQPITITVYVACLAP